MQRVSCPVAPQWVQAVGSRTKPAHCLDVIAAPGDDPGSNPLANPSLFLQAEESGGPQHQPHRPLPTCKTSPRTRCWDSAWIRLNTKGKKHRDGGGRMEETPNQQPGNKAHPVHARLLAGNTQHTQPLPELFPSQIPGMKKPDPLSLAKQHQYSKKNSFFFFFVLFSCWPRGRELSSGAGTAHRRIGHRF